jgi:hypothetical protein
MLLFLNTLSIFIAPSTIAKELLLSEVLISFNAFKRIKRKKE